MKICKVEGCNKKYYARGYCYKHYCQVNRCGKVLERTRLDSNEIIIKGDIAEVVLYDQKSREVARTIIDTEDVEKIKKYKWHLSTYGYAATTTKRRSLLKIQHVVLGIKADRKNQIDHIDRKKLNNSKSNLRICTNDKNCRNRGTSKANTSGYKGVSWNKHLKKWSAYIYKNYKRNYLGMFKTSKEAAKAYNKACIKLHGEFACLNKV